MSIAFKGSGSGGGGVQQFTPLPILITCIFLYSKSFLQKKKSVDYVILLVYFRSP